MERMAKDSHGLSENKAPARQSYNTIKTTKPKVLENITRESAGAKVTPSTLSGTLHGNAILIQKRSAALHGSAFAEVPPSPAASRRRPSRKMQNERHAAWERLFLKRTSATLHGSAFFLNHEPSTGPDRTRPPKRQPKATQEDAQDRKRTAPRIDT